VFTKTLFYPSLLFFVDQHCCYFLNFCVFTKFSVSSSRFCIQTSSAARSRLYVGEEGGILSVQCKIFFVHNLYHWKEYKSISNWRSVFVVLCTKNIVSIDHNRKTLPKNHRNNRNIYATTCVMEKKVFFHALVL